ESPNMAPMRGPAGPIDKLLLKWIEEPDLTLETSDAVSRVFDSNDQFDMKVKNMLTLFCTWLVKCNEEGVSHRELGAYRRDLLKDYFSPWCRNEQALSKGATLQDRLDVMAAQIGYVTPVVVKESKRTE
ncbi:hypothetical protein FOL47_005872, partial [Perkinsus chesapeaki]